MTNASPNNPGTAARTAKACQDTLFTTPAVKHAVTVYLLWIAAVAYAHTGFAQNWLLSIVKAAKEAGSQGSARLPDTLGITSLLRRSDFYEYMARRNLSQHTRHRFS
eukprot:TRINITY_DN10824_c0_g1_i2.p2 TRINITY_DN10824_c0_g1~~TRINITY_DN10824_c0_g1_i2.p2  ORF type:complete len:107 (-),score=13.97 TRINITY_DN10824_c0_g1_i2:242-562(-)